MKSKVISIRIPVDILASSISILSRAGVSTASMSLSSIIRMICTASVNGAIKNGDTIVYDEEAALTLLAEWEPDEIEVQQKGLLSSLRDMIDEEREVDIVDHVPETGTSAHDLAILMQTASEPSVAEESLVIAETVEDVIDTSDLYRMDYSPLDDLLKIAPKDVLLEAFINSKEVAGEEEKKEIYQRCIEIIYHRAEVGDWGTEAVQLDVANLYSNYQ